MSDTGSNDPYDPNRPSEPSEPQWGAQPPASSQPSSDQPSSGGWGGGQLGSWGEQQGGQQPSEGQPQYGQPGPPQYGQPAPPYAGGQFGGQPQYGQPQYGQPQYGGPHGSPPPNYLVWAILSTLFCCLPLGIVSIVYAAQVNGKYASGDLAGAQESSRKAKQFAIWSAVVGVIVAVLYLVAVIGLASSSSS